LNSLYKNLIFWTIIVIVMVLLFNLFSKPRQTASEKNYSEFISALENNRVQEVEALGRNLTWKDKDGKRFKTYAPEDPEMIKILREKGVIINAKKESDTSLLQIVITLAPILLLIGVWLFFMKQMQVGGGKALSFGKSKAKILTKELHQVTFDNVAGIEEAKDELEEIIAFLRDPKIFTKLGGRIPKGVLLIGAPGTGKTLLARAIAGEADVPFFSISGSEFVEMFVGVGAARVRDMFSQAVQKAPCIVFIDELDALGKTRGSNPVGGHDEREQTLNQLLVEMDGFDANTGVIIMSATNRPETLDPALLRPGRFDRQVVVDRPDLNGREAILVIHSKGVKLDENVNLKSIAAMTPGFVGADLANIINESALLAARRSKDNVGMSEIEEAIERVMAGLEKKKRLINKQEKEIVAHHECGHALVASSLKTTDRVKKISIIPRGVAALGYTLQLPTEDRYMMTRGELTDRISVLLGGRIAEEIIFNEVSTGAQNDLEKASDIARRMVKYYGMSEKLGIVTFEPESKPAFMGWGMSTNKEYSEETAREIDIEVKKIIDDVYVSTREILEKQKPMLIKLSKVLMEKEVIEGEELKNILNDEIEEKTDATKVN